MSDVSKPPGPFYEPSTAPAAPHPVAHPRQRLLQAPCERIDRWPAAGHPRADQKVAEAVRLLADHIGICVPAPRPTAQVCDDGLAGDQLPRHDRLADAHRRSLIKLMPVQAWLRETLLERDAATGELRAVPRDELSRWLSESLSWTQDAVAELGALVDLMGLFRAGLPQWLIALTDAPADGTSVPQNLTTLLERCGIRATRDPMSATEWVLLLAKVAANIEQRWLTASVSHQVALMSLFRLELLHALADKLDQHWEDVRRSVEADDSVSLPVELQWIDQARAQGTDAVWAIRRDSAR